MNYFIIPGNPPAVHFYQLWGEEIIAKVPTAKVRVSHYPKLAKNSNSENAMNDVVLAHLEQLVDFYNQTKSPISIIGHSLGGNIGLRLLHKDQNEMVKEAILIHPFLKRPSKLGQLILKAASSFYERDALKARLIRNRRFLEYLSSDLPHVTDEEMEKAFHLAKHESIVIATDSNPLHIHPEKRDKVSVFYKRNDPWCTAEVIAELREQVKLFECPEPHNFVTSKLHRHSLLDKILKY
jgi:predicted alpha/beta hydrolase family esterase